MSCASTGTGPCRRLTPRTSFICDGVPAGAPCITCVNPNLEGSCSSVFEDCRPTTTTASSGSSGGGGGIGPLVAVLATMMVLVLALGLLFVMVRRRRRRAGHSLRAPQGHENPLYHVPDRNQNASYYTAALGGAEADVANPDERAEGARGTRRGRGEHEGGTRGTRRRENGVVLSLRVF